MSDIKYVTDNFAVSGQISTDDLVNIAALGFKTIVANRPDGEGGPNQPSMLEIKSRAQVLGLEFIALPFSGVPGDDLIRRTSNLLRRADTPALAYCRTGTRAATLWAFSQLGTRHPDEIIASTVQAGHDLEPIRDILEAEYFLEEAC